MPQSFHYGGQAVIEGVMIKGRRNMAVAVRQPDGALLIHSEALTSALSTHPWARWPFVRGIISLAETLVLGVKSLLFSASVAMGEDVSQVSSRALWGTMVMSLLFASALFFVFPLLVTHLLDPYLSSSLGSNMVEGAIRLTIFLAYIIAVGFMSDIRRVFAYHGAEHKAVNAYEDGSPLDPDHISAYSTAHSRCGTGFLLTVFLLSILVFALLGRPPLAWRMLSRLLLIPLLAAVGYELLRLGAEHFHNRVVRAVLTPSLALQTLTTREPDRGQMEVAAAALKHVLMADGAIEEKSVR